MYFYYIMDCQACKGKHVKHTCSKSRTYKKRKITKKDVVEDKMEEEMEEMEEEDEQDNNGDGTQCEEMQSEEEGAQDEDKDDGDNEDDEESEEEGAQDDDKVFQINEIIYARWNGNGLMYLARIININDKIYSIMFMTDLKTKQVSKVHLDDIHKRIELKKNMLVSAIYKGKGDGYNHMFTPLKL